jgi:hypothetical protein
MPRSSAPRSASRLLSLVALCALVPLFAVSSPAAAQGWDFGVRTGYYTDAEEFFLGLELLHPIRDTAWMFNPNVEYVDVDNGSLWALSVDFHYDFDLDLDNVDVWAGAGPTLLVRDFDRGPFRDEDDSDVGLNVIGGAGAKDGAVRPYGQIKLIVADDTEVALQVGLRFF